MNHTPHMLDGVPIYTSEPLTEPKVEVVQRTWRERLFSRPWHPMQKTKEITIYVPSLKCLVSDTATGVFGRKCFIMHPVMLQKIRAELEARCDVEETAERVFSSR